MRKRLSLISSLLLLTLLFFPEAAFAAPPAQAAGEGNLGFLLAGTLVVWGGFFAYAFYLGRKNHDLHRELEELRQSIADKGTHF